MEATVSIDKRIVKQRFDRAAARYDAAAVLPQEIGRRMLERLGLVKLAPARILDAGSGTGALGSALIERYPRAALIEVDLSLQMLRAAPRPPGVWQRLIGSRRAAQRYRVCADMERLPIAAASVQLVCSNLALAWSGRPQSALSELHRALVPGGLLMFTTLGPDTLRELRLAREALGSPHEIHPFIDLHDLGDMLVACGFADPVMDMEHLTLTYRDCDGLLAELKALGGGSALSPRARGLRGRAWRARLCAAYEAFRHDGRLPLTVEVVYGHAWKAQAPAGRRADGRAVIRLQPGMRAK